MRGGAALRQYGLALGTAYQLYDDCLDVLGSESRPAKRSERTWPRAK